MESSMLKATLLRSGQIRIWTQDSWSQILPHFFFFFLNKSRKTLHSVKSLILGVQFRELPDAHIPVWPELQCWYRTFPSPQKSFHPPLLAHLTSLKYVLIWWFVNMAVSVFRSFYDVTWVYDISPECTRCQRVSVETWKCLRDRGTGVSSKQLLEASSSAWIGPHSWTCSRMTFTVSWWHSCSRMTFTISRQHSCSRMTFTVSWWHSWGQILHAKPASQFSVWAVVRVQTKWAFKQLLLILFHVTFLLWHPCPARFVVLFLVCVFRILSLGVIIQDILELGFKTWLFPKGSWHL